MLLARITFVLSVLSLASRASEIVISEVSSQDRLSGDLLGVCMIITSSLSTASHVFYPTTPQYVKDNEHAFVSSSEHSACSVEPGSAEDVAVIVGSITRIVLFLESTDPISHHPCHSCKSSVGRARPSRLRVADMQQTFTSPRLQISLSRLNQLKFGSEADTVEVGPGLTWDSLYQQLHPFNVTVIGGRTPDVGVGGLLLGGGYSFKSNQYGLGIDNIVAYELVLPNGTIKTVTESDQDLWFALRGIVTKFTLKSYAQGKVWGSISVYASDKLEAIKNAITNFGKVADTKASLVSALIYSSGKVGRHNYVSVLRRSSTSVWNFDDFLNIPSSYRDIKMSSYVNFVKGLVTQVTPAHWPLLWVRPTRYSTSILDDIVDQVLYWGSKLTALDPKVQVLAGIEPFTSGLLSHGTPSAYPPDRSQIYFPSGVALTWSNSSLDQVMAQSVRKSADDLQAAALKEGQNVTHAVVYPNYALFDTPLEAMYGNNVDRLRELKRAVDPANVMGFAGGFKF
ncbi:hypothetical protein B0F90DRAFT_1825823 [Multifurca ochricompacta]|uniref:FAD-binding PCMH-type domain-containing protein n=1 Tax=Multifurca ochricompacta TaxID=376703 RepID=A0AAD4LSY7_9AGAM|nr:hypothetical protein B0F90DRAFT_1825823 [Multifurca ochricompacta]